MKGNSGEFINRPAIYVCLMFLTCLLLSACTSGRGAETAAETESEGNKTEKVKIGVSIYKYDDVFMKLYREELKKYLEQEYDAQVVMTDAGGNRYDQDSQIDGLIRQGCDALILNLVVPSEASGVVERCKKEGIPVVFINREPPKTEIDRWEKEKISASYVGTPADQAGVYQAEILMETPDKGDINGDGTVSCILITGDPDSPAATERTQFFLETMKNAGIRTEVVYSQCGYWERERGKVLTGRALSRFGLTADAVICNNDAMAQGALEAIREAKRSVGGDIYLIGVDGLQACVQAVMAGDMTGTVLNDYMGQSHVAADLAVKLSKGERVEKRCDIDDIKISLTDSMDDWQRQ